MPKQTVEQKSPRATQPAASPSAQGIVLAPPAYGIDLADNQPVEAQGVAIQRREAPAATCDSAPGIPHRTGLPDALKSGIESLSGVSLDDVRVRFNSSRPARLQALAYTQGSEIHVAPGQARHLPHEAWHVVQQKQGRVRATMQLKGTAINDDAGLEHEADVMGARAVQLKSAVQRSAPVRMSAPIPIGGSGYRIVAGEAGHPVGSVSVHAQSNTSIEVTNLGVDPAHRAQGIGKALIASAARTGLQLGKAKVALAAQDTGSGRLTQWYKRMGFAQVGVHQSGYPQLEAPIGRVLGGVAQRREKQYVARTQPPLTCGRNGAAWIAQVRPAAIPHAYASEHGVVIQRSEEAAATVNDAPQMLSSVRASVRPLRSTITVPSSTRLPNTIQRMIGPPVAPNPAVRITNITTETTRYKHFASKETGAEGKMDYNGPYKGNVTVIRINSSNAEALEAAIAFKKPDKLVRVKVTGWTVNNQISQGKFTSVLIKYDNNGIIYHVEAG